MTQQSPLIGIAFREKAFAPMQTVDQIYISKAHGTGQDSRGKPGKRQVTLLSLQHWKDACNEIQMPLDWTARRSNLLVESLTLENTREQFLCCGDVILQITGDTDPCSRMRDIHPKLFDALNQHWRGGVNCRVIREGQLKLNECFTLTDTLP